MKNHSSCATNNKIDIMKQLLLLFLLLNLTNVFAQDLRSIDKQLNDAFGKINYWAFVETTDENINRFDSLQTANELFESLLVKYTTSNLETISFAFQSLADSGLRIATSEDGLFRIYSWDTWTGGSMHYFRNVFQYKTDNRIFSQVLKSTDELNAGCFYYEIDDIISDNKTFYITQSTAILSSGLFYHKIKVFSIDDSKLNDKAQLIKTSTGVRNELGYEVDLTASSNRNREKIPNFLIQYDKKNKILSIPLIFEDSKVTDKRIRYQFKGRYFEKA